MLGGLRGTLWMFLLPFGELVSALAPKLLFAGRQLPLCFRPATSLFVLSFSFYRLVSWPAAIFLFGHFAPCFLGRPSESAWYIFWFAGFEGECGIAANHASNASLVQDRASLIRKNSHRRRPTESGLQTGTSRHDYMSRSPKLRTTPKSGPARGPAADRGVRPTQFFWAAKNLCTTQD